MGIAVSYHETVTKLQGLGDSAQGPFDRPEWFSLLAEDGSQPLIALGDDGERRGALVLRHGADGLESLTNWFSFVWRPLGATPAMLVAMARDLRRRSSRIQFSPLDADDVRSLGDAFRRGGWLTFSEICDENHVLPVAGRSFAEYWRDRPGKMRTTLKRKAKKVEIEILVDFDELAWAAYRRVYEQSWKPAEERADVLEAFAREEGRAGRLRLGIARAGGEPVAAQFWTVERGTAYIHKLAHIEAAKPLSAGTTLTAALFEHVIDTDKVELVDFGTGSDAYKRDWMEVIRPRYRLLCLDWRRPRNWPQIARAAVRHLARPLARG